MSGRWPDIVCRRQISSAQSADIVLTAGQDIVNLRCPGKLFPNHWEAKRFCRSGNDIRLRRTKSTPAAWTISRLCRDDILPVVGRWPRRYPPGGRTLRNAAVIRPLVKYRRSGRYRPDLRKEKNKKRLNAFRRTCVYTLSALPAGGEGESASQPCKQGGSEFHR